ncbi:MAG: substrate-binding domain-containing protein [Actinomycetales bacterium]
MTRPRKGMAIALFTAGALALAACSGGGAEPSSDGGGGGGGGNSGYTIAMVTHETSGDLFWDKIKAGAEQAATDTGATLKYSNDPDATKQATLVQNAVDSQVDGIAVTMATPDALRASMQNAVAADIPLVAFNSGINDYKDAGASMYFGSDETLAGQTAGERIAAEGGVHPLCVIQQSGSVALEARCAGVKAKVPGTENIQVNGANDADVVATLQAKLAADPSIDWVVTLGAQQAMAALQSRQAAGSSAKVVTFDLSADVAQKIKDGEVVFSIDQQPYLQGYMAVTMLYLNIKNGNDIGGGQPTLTGPSFVDQDNIDVILPFAENNTR